MRNFARSTLDLNCLQIIAWTHDLFFSFFFFFEVALRCFLHLTQCIILILGRPMMILTEFLESGSLDNFLKVRFMTSMFIISVN